MEKILISDAAKQVQVESHVLRYWEEELHLPIQRNKQGHRYYTTEDVNRFKQIKTMKEQGFQLKAIRSALDGSLAGIGDASGGAALEQQKKQDGAAEPMKQHETVQNIRGGKPEQAGDGKTGQAAAVKKAGQAAAVEKAEPAAKDGKTGQASGSIKTQKKDTGSKGAKDRRQDKKVEVVAVVEEHEIADQEKAGKAARLQFLLQHMIAEAVRENNEQLCENVKQMVAKEMDYQFRQQEEKELEREAERLKREEEHYRQLDMLLRGKSRKETRKERRKRAFGLQKQGAEKQEIQTQPD